MLVDEVADMFHYFMLLQILYKIGAVDPLKWLASTPNRVASKLAAQALKIIGEEVPHKLSQQVPLWASDDVVHWIGQVMMHIDLGCQLLLLLMHLL